MLSQQKHIKLSTHRESAKFPNEKNSSAANRTDSAYISQADCTTDTSTQSSRPKGFESIHTNKRSFDSDQSSGFSSQLSSFNRSPKKRKFPDENAFHNPTPHKRIRSDQRVLREKSSSENVIRSSTPIRDGAQKTKFSRFRSFNPEKFAISKNANQVLPPPVVTEESFDAAFDLDFSASFNLTHDGETSIPNNFQKLLSADIRAPETITKSIDSFGEISSLETSPEISSLKTSPEVSNQENSPALTPVSSFASSNTPSYYGRSTLDILKKLQQQENPAVRKVLSFLSDIDLVSLSHVSQGYRDLVKSYKPYEDKRQNYLKAYQKDRENIVPGKAPRTIAKVEKKEKRKNFGEVNVNHSMQLRPKLSSPPVSPSRRNYSYSQKLTRTHNTSIPKCPLCTKSAIIKIMRIRCSPRKRKKTNIMKLSTTNAGRVQKRQSKSFLAKPSIDSQMLVEPLYSTLPTFDDNSGSDSSYGISPRTPSSDESSGSETHETQIYEYAVCEAAKCSFKFCLKCKSKSHPHQQCRELSPPSPNRSSFSTNVSIACSNKSKKSLKRLFH